MAFSIRLAEPDDIGAIRAITERAYAIWLPVLGYPAQPVTDDHRPRIDRGEVWLAVEKDTVVGLIAVEPKADHDLIFNVAVDPDHTGKAIGTRLMAEAEQRAKAAGKDRVRLYTNLLMDANIALYTRLGYKKTGQRQNPARPEFTIVDMEKRLA